jgi:serine-type D-Ala-D-Ala carboxypeptidase/endopeptidase (penicillin-binding protein 4)
LILPFRFASTFQALALITAARKLIRGLVIVGASCGPCALFAQGTAAPANGAQNNGAQNSGAQTIGPQTKLAAPLEAFRRAGVPLADVSLFAIPVDQGDAIIAHNAESPFILASTAKLITTMAALDILGPSYRWRTSAFLNGTLADGVLTGDLLLVGGGDPMLSSDKLVAWFALMQKRGLKEISGNIVLDRRRFALVDKDHVNTPKPAWHNPHHAQPDGFVIDEGVLKVNIAPTSAGKTITLEPAIEGIEVIDQTKVVARCSLVKTSLAVDFEEASQNRKLIVSGDWAQDCSPHKLAIHPWDQTEYSRAAILAAWRQAGGKILGSVVEAPPPSPPVKRKRNAKPMKAPKPRKPFLTLDSKPLSESVRETNKWSNNLVSRHLLLSMSKGFPREVATLQNAQQILGEWLLRKTVTPEDMIVENGSGLSRGERGKTRHFGLLLKDAWTASYDKDFKASLPIVGVDGTMGSRLRNSAVAGKAFIKTGTLTDVRSVAGYVTTKDGRNIAAVAIVNHANASRAVVALDAFIEWLHAGQ